MRRRTVIARELRGLAFSICAVVGVLLGTLWALNHPVAVPPACDGTTSRALGHCVSHSIAVTLRPFLEGIGAGAVGGMVVGWLAASLIPRPKARARRRG